MDFTVVHIPGKDEGMLTFICTLLNFFIWFSGETYSFWYSLSKDLFPNQVKKKIKILWLFIFPHIELYDRAFYDKVYRENGAASSFPLLAWRGSFRFSYSPLYFHCCFRQRSVVQELKDLLSSYCPLLILLGLKYFKRSWLQFLWRDSSSVSHLVRHLIWIN